MKPENEKERFERVRATGEIPESWAEKYQRLGKSDAPVRIQTFQ
jgi:hypothetical protein